MEKGERNSETIKKKKTVVDTEEINDDFYIDRMNKKWKFLQMISSKDVRKTFPGENNVVFKTLSINGKIRFVCHRYSRFDVERCSYNGTSKFLM